MTRFGKVGNSLWLLMGLALATLLATAPCAAADPGDKAARQRRYPAIQEGAKELLRANEALDSGDNKFKGHRVAAMKLITEALSELDEAVEFADNTGKTGEKTDPLFDPERGQLASSQEKYLAIRGGAKHVIAAGKALDRGQDKFGGHRVKALKTLNSALDELELAAKEGK